MLKEIIERVASLKKLHPLTTTGMEKLYVQDMDTLLSLISRMRECLGEMVYLFDRDLPKSSIGRATCDQARAILKEKE